MRREAQPSGIKTFGSTFKNPDPDDPGAEGRTAGQLLEAAGCQGSAVGGARFSPKHANFVENTGAATTADVLAVMAAGRRRVHEAVRDRARARGPGARARSSGPTTGSSTRPNRPVAAGAGARAGNLPPMSRSRASTDAGRRRASTARAARGRPAQGGRAARELRGQAPKRRRPRAAGTLDAPRARAPRRTAKPPRRSVPRPDRAPKRRRSPPVAAPPAEPVRARFSRCARSGPSAGPRGATGSASGRDPRRDAGAAGYFFWLRDSSLVAVDDVDVVGVTSGDRAQIVGRADQGRRGHDDPARRRGAARAGGAGLPDGRLGQRRSRTSRTACGSRSPSARRRCS